MNPGVGARPLAGLLWKLAGSVGNDRVGIAVSDYLHRGVGNRSDRSTVRECVPTSQRQNDKDTRKECFPDRGVLGKSVFHK